MAKKAIASSRKEKKTFAKVIRWIKSQKTGAYTYKTEMVPIEEAQKRIKS